MFKRLLRVRTFYRTTAYWGWFVCYVLSHKWGKGTFVDSDGNNNYVWCKRCGTCGRVENGNIKITTQWRI